jgi:transcriptional regulator with XRE-family HTH domain
MPSAPQPSSPRPARDPCAAFLGQAVRGARWRARLTQAELAERAGVRRELVGQLERGDANPTFAVFVKIARALGVPASQLVRAAEDASRRARSSP